MSTKTKFELNSNMSKLEEIKGVSGSRGGRSIPSIGLVNNVNGKRLTISDFVHQQLGKPPTIQVGMIKDERLLIIASKLPDAKKSYRLSIKNKAIAYNAGLVGQISESFNLDYSEITSKTFTDIEFQELENVTVAIIKIPLDNNENLNQDTEDEVLAV